MARLNNLTDAGRRKAAAQTNKITAARKVKRLVKVKFLVDKKMPKKEIARLLKVRPKRLAETARHLESEFLLTGVGRMW